MLSGIGAGNQSQSHLLEIIMIIVGEHNRFSMAPLPLIKQKLQQIQYHCLPHTCHYI